MDKFLRGFAWVYGVILVFLVVVAVLSLFGVFANPLIDPGM